MKKLSNLFQKVLPHSILILSLMFAVFLILDQYNPLMQFLDNGISRILLGILLLLSIISSTRSITFKHRG